jgi:hypothetical protein
MLGEAELQSQSEYLVNVFAKLVIVSTIYESFGQCQVLVVPWMSRGVRILSLVVHWFVLLVSSTAYTPPRRNRSTTVSGVTVP